MRREAVSSSSIEGTQSTLDEILSLEEAGGDDVKYGASQVRDYDSALDDLIPVAAKEGNGIFTIDDRDE